MLTVRLSIEAQQLACGSHSTAVAAMRHKWVYHNPTCSISHVHGDTLQTNDPPYNIGIPFAS
jgi:hypothetical protein